MKRVYIAGPMTNVPKFNIPAFDDAAADLRARGYDVVSPAELDDPVTRSVQEESETGDPADLPFGETWGHFLSRDVKLLADDGIEAVVVLPGWHASRGARLETFVGRLCGLPLLRYPDLSEVSAETIDLAHGHLDDGRIKVFARPTPGVFTVGGPFGDASEVRVVDPATGGTKGSKLEQAADLDPAALMLVYGVAGFGAQKYSHLNYMRGMAWSLLYNAMQRHLHQYWNGEERDDESGLPHLAHACWHCLALLAYTQRGLGTDDRISSGRHLVTD